MSNVKYRVREFTPTQNQGGTHSFYAEAVINTDITSVELAKKIAARTGIKSYEAQAVIHAIADIVAEETLEGSRISLNNEGGTKLVTIYPKVTGSISDKDVQANPEKYNGAQVATEDMLKPEMLQWTLGATIGIKYAKSFALNKQAQKVKFSATDVPAEPTEGDDTGNTGNTGGNQGGGGQTEVEG